MVTDAAVIAIILFYVWLAAVECCKCRQNAIVSWICIYCEVAWRCRASAWYRLTQNKKPSYR